MKENSATIHVQVPVDVAAFLLNEKRGEVLKIENRHRISVILIPNKHLDTPHYKLERIKHDDPRLEDSQASYSLAESAETDMAYSKRQKEEAKPRQEAMVKTITPDQPAPLVERKPAETVKAAPVAVVAPASKGFWAKLMSVILPEKEVAVRAPVARAAAAVTASRAAASATANRAPRVRRRTRPPNRPTPQAVRPAHRVRHASRVNRAKTRLSKARRHANAANALNAPSVRSAPSVPSAHRVHRANRVPTRLSWRKLKWKSWHCRRSPPSRWYPTALPLTPPRPS